MTTLTNDTVKKFYQDLANILRLTHGQIFTAIAAIRAQTKNTLVRELADVANNTVLDHITVMEQTGLVDFDSLVSLSQRYDRPGPRYTSYPTAVEFSERFDEAAYRQLQAELAK